MIRPPSSAALSVALLVPSLALVILNSVAARAEATIGVFGDPEGTLGSIEFVFDDDDFPTYSNARVYVVAKNVEGGMVAYEYGFTGSLLDHQGTWFVLTTRSGGPAPLNVDGCQFPFQSGCLYGLGGCVEDDPFVMTEYWLLATDPLPDDLLLCADRGFNPSSFDDEPGYMQCDFETLTTFVPAPNPCYDVPDGCAVVNPSVPCGIVDTPESSFGAIKALYGG